MIGFHADSPVGAADAHEGNGLLLEDPGIQAFLALLLELAVQHQQHAGVVAGAHAVGQHVEQAGAAGLIDGIHNQDAVRLHHLFVEGGVVVLLGADHALAHDQALGAGHAAGAVFDVPVEHMDKFDFRTGVAGGFQCHAAHGVVVAVFRSAGKAQDLHGSYLLK